MKKRNTSVDWSSVEKAYRLGQLSVREIARQHNVDVAAISRKAKSLGWTRDYTAEVRKGVNAKLIASTPEATVPTREDIEKAQSDAASVVRSHRRGLQASQNICVSLFEQLRSASENRDELEAIADEEAGDGIGASKRRAQFRKALSLPTHAGVIRDLSTAMKNFQAMERIAWNLNPGDDGEEGAESKNLTLSVGFVKANG